MCFKILENADTAINGKKYNKEEDEIIRDIINIIIHLNIEIEVCGSDVVKEANTVFYVTA